MGGASFLLGVIGGVLITNALWLLPSVERWGKGADDLFELVAAGMMCLVAGFLCAGVNDKGK